MVMGVPSKYELTATTDPYYCSTYVKVKVTRAGDDRHPLASRPPSASASWSRRRRSTRC